MFLVDSVQLQSNLGGEILTFKTYPKDLLLVLNHCEYTGIGLT